MTKPKSGWLDMSRHERIQPTDMEVRTAEFQGCLRGVQRIDFKKLARAMTMKVVRLPGAKEGEPNFLVIPTDGSDSDWTKYYPEDPEGEYVNLFDRDIERCHCQDFIWRGETKKEPCCHILAALIDIQHPSILPFVAELRERNDIAKAVNQ